MNALANFVLNPRRSKLGELGCSNSAEFYRYEKIDGVETMHWARRKRSRMAEAPWRDMLESGFKDRAFEILSA